MLHLKKKIFPYLAILLACALFSQCRESVRFSRIDQYPDIFPDYIGVTIPASMAANDAALLDFMMKDGREISVERQRKGNTIWMTVSAWEKGEPEGLTYKAFPIYISDDEIDPYVAYRLIEPGYESWTNISICQRELASYEETDIVTNKINEQGCINCHQFAAGNPQQMLFHSRAADGGTFFIHGDEMKKIDFKTLGAQKQATYPAWHPSGKLVAFSSNKTQQCFMMKGKQPIEVYDTASDIILYNVVTNEVTAPPFLNTEDTWETFPSWNSDGTKFYYCAADSVSHMPEERARVHYRLMSVDFDTLSGSFIGSPTAVPLSGIDMEKHSVSFPRINGEWLLFTLTDFGTFPIWHAEADLWLANLITGELRPCNELNSHSAESYHNWPTNGKWIVFGSRREDGRYTRLYFSHFDGKGHFTKPFMLPQEKAENNQLRLKSYNIPEFIKGKAKPINNTKGA